ncbi:DNA-binding transcriptional regulator, LacI/PurR family [Microlunatus sagamiharensis]|uniref:DNA-binding transcriptional regulator, LacI/PurR family n=1 Tax=Microlunatus sagamiharensis TaxID=546874 RepID=A0A1H2MA71_9ACTN|nr:LacI family DNA-binding transcriptional regulator [Microlunatus sagamiharensis]SDU89994.1 DNA-binding transcriptional regulator, LacI/PurR family [Microlunatus sagamiharensis]
MTPTIHDVARLAEVSIKTVSNVMNDYPHIRPATRQRVLDAIATLDYKPNLSARGLRSGKTGLLSLIIPDLRNPYFAELADVVVRSAEARGLSVMISQSNGDRDRELSLLLGPRMQMVDGVLFSALALSAADSDLLGKIRTPMVLLGERILDGPKDHVTMRNVEGSQAATEHLVSIGRRRLVAFGSDPAQGLGSAALRLEGYRRALAGAGIEEDPDLVVDVVGWYRRNGADSMRRFLERGTDFDGVVAFNDQIALGALRVMQEAGLRIPDDVAIIGFDDVDETAYTLPSLSTIDPGREEIAEVALRYLVGRIDGSDADVAPRDHLTTFRLQQRESTAVV